VAPAAGGARDARPESVSDCSAAAAATQSQEQMVVFAIYPPGAISGAAIGRRVVSRLGGKAPEGAEPVGAAELVGEELVIEPGQQPMQPITARAGFVAKMFDVTSMALARI
jgi:hypothetical protein